MMMGTVQEKRVFHLYSVRQFMKTTGKKGILQDKEIEIKRRNLLKTYEKVSEIVEAAKSLSKYGLSKLIFGEDK